MTVLLHFIVNKTRSPWIFICLLRESSSVSFVSLLPSTSLVILRLIRWSSSVSSMGRPPSMWIVCIAVVGRLLPGSDLLGLDAVLLEVGIVGRIHALGTHPQAPLL